MSATTFNWQPCSGTRNALLKVALYLCLFILTLAFALPLDRAVCGAAVVGVAPIAKSILCSSALCGWSVFDEFAFRSPVSRAYCRRLFRDERQDERKRCVDND